MVKKNTRRLTKNDPVELCLGKPPSTTWVHGTVSYVSDGSHYIVDVPSGPHRGRYAVTPGHEDLRVP
jgi:hypothetical protein